MAECLLMGMTGGGSGSNDVTATTAQVLSGYTAITSNSNDEPAEGTIPVKEAQTYYPTTADQTISSGQYLNGAQTIKGLTQTNLTSANIAKGVAVRVNNGNTNVYDVVGSWYGNKYCMNVQAFKGFGLPVANWITSDEQTFTMPTDGTLYYGGFTAAANATYGATCEVYVNDVIIDSRNIDTNGANANYRVRGTMVNQSYAVSTGDVIKIKCTVIGTSSYAVATIQAVVVY